MRVHELKSMTKIGTRIIKDEKYKKTIKYVREHETGGEKPTK